MNSIKKKLFLRIGLLIFLLICLLLMANTFLFKPFYINKEKKQLIKYYEHINKINTSEYDDFLKDFISIENTSNIDIFIHDPTGNILYSSRAYILGKDINSIKKRMQHFKNKSSFPMILNKEEAINDNVKIAWADDRFTNTQNLHIIGTLDNGNRINLRLPLLSMEKNICLANQFSLIIGVILFFIGMITAYFLSKSFTRPILDMNKATINLKNLNFDSKCDVESNDEIGQLAQSINEMSSELASAISSLNISNMELQKQIREKSK